MATEEKSSQRTREPEEMEIDLVELLYRLLERVRYLIIAALLGALIAGIYTFYFVTPMYQATSKLYILSSKDSVVNLSDLQMGSNLARDYIEVFNTWKVNQDVIQELNLNYSISKAKSMVRVTNQSGTRILYITVTSPDPAEAQKMANTYAIKAKEFIAATMSTDEPNVFEEALRPTAPASPNKVRNIAIGFLAGLLLAAVIVVVQFIVDDRVRSAEAIERKLGLPVLGMMPAAGQEDHESSSDSGHAKRGGKGGRK